MNYNLQYKQKRALLTLVISDYIISVIAWVVFWLYRQSWLHEKMPEVYLSERNWTSRDYYLSFIIVPICWLLCYYLCGTYFDSYRRSRLMEILRTFISSIIGTLILSMIAFSNDVDSFKYYFAITSWYFLAHFCFLVISRLIIFKKLKSDLVNKKVFFNTIIIGSNGKVEKIYNEIKNNRKIIGNKIVGFVNYDDKQEISSAESVPVLGSLNNVENIIKNHKIEEVIIALESQEHNALEQILVSLSYSPVIIRVKPDLYDIISGSVRTNTVFQPVFIRINPELLPDWQRVIKRAMDISVAILTITLLSPLYIFAAIRTKMSSPGGIIFKQARIGLYGKPFYIYKFRSMYLNAEKDGPQLSSDKDKRITPWGKIMRKWRIDEIPQFFNVLKGDMSLVGPRPERNYFIQKIIVTHPHYKYLHRVKPGITSWGMVEYGYAENIDQMIERMKFDLLYIRNCSIALDIKIMLYTIKVLVQGRGK